MLHFGLSYTVLYQAVVDRVKAPVDLTCFLHVDTLNGYRRRLVPDSILIKMKITTDDLYLGSVLL
jgi:hypothetical protein